MSAARERHLQEFESDGPEKVRENISLNRYDRRSLARAVLWLEQFDSRITVGARRRADDAFAPVGRRPPPRKFGWVFATAAATAIVAAVAFFLGRFAF